MTDLENSMRQMQRDIKRLRSIMENHIGDNGEAHPIPSDGSAGFMPYHLYEKNQEWFEERPWIAKNGDTLISVKGLAPGMYSTSADQLDDNPPNSAGNAIVMIDVTQYVGGRKNILYKIASINQTWIKTVHTPSASTDAAQSSGWFLLAGCYPLWSGNTSTGSFILSKASTSFSWLDFRYVGPLGNVGSAVVLSTRNPISLTTSNFPDGTISNQFTVTEMRIGRNSSTDYTILGNQNIALTGDGFKQVDGKMSLTAVYGWNQ